MGTYPVLPMVLRLSLSLVSVAPRWPWPLGAYPVPLDTLPRSSSRRVLLGSCCGQFAPLEAFFHGSPLFGDLGALARRGDRELCLVVSLHPESLLPEWPLPRTEDFRGSDGLYGFCTYYPLLFSS